VPLPFLAWPGLAWVAWPGGERSEQGEGAEHGMGLQGGTVRRNDLAMLLA